MTRSSAVGDAREPLPLDASRLPSIGEDARRVLDEGLRHLSLDISPAVRTAIDVHARLLAAWGRHVNLTAIREPVDVARLHVLDSLSALAPIHARIPVVRWVVDIGSGGGYPGIPLGLALGAERISLVESVGRKARFLDVAGAAVTAALGDATREIEVLPVRAEALARGHRRGSWEVALVRAVGSVAECAELALPLLTPGGLLVCWKRDRGGAIPEQATSAGVAAPDLRLEVDAARPLIGQLGGAAPEVLSSGLPGAPGHRLVLVRKDRPTPARFPRPPAARRPARRAC